MGATQTGIYSVHGVMVILRRFKTHSGGPGLGENDMMSDDNTSVEWA